MKRILIAAAVVFCGSLLAAPAGIDQGAPAAYINGSLPSTVGGIFYSDATRAMYRAPRVDLRDYVVLGKVEGTAEMKNILFFVNLGDTGFEALKKSALRAFPDADDIVNFEIDAHHFNVFLFFMQETVTIRGIAVKYPTK